MTSTTHPAPPATYRSVLAVAEFRVVLASWTISMLGNILADVALAVLVLERTGSPLLSALVMALAFIPFVIGGSLLSAASDRYPPRAVLVTGDVVRAGLVALMTVPSMPVWALLVLVGTGGVISPVYGGARSASLPHMVSEPEFPLARALLRMVAMTSQVVGFGLGGALLTVLSPRPLLALDALSFVLSAGLLRFGTRRRPAFSGASDRSRSLVRDSLAGLGDALRSPRLRPLLLLGWLPPLVAVAPEALAVPYAHHLAAPRWGVGLLLGSPALGSIVGDVVMGACVRARRREQLVLPLVLLQVVPLLAFAAHPGLRAAAVLMFVVGFAWSFEVGLDQQLLRALDDGQRGLVLSVSASGLMLCQGLGFAVAGAAAELLPITTVVSGAGVVGLCLLAVLYGSGRRSPAQDRL